MKVKLECKEDHSYQAPGRAVKFVRYALPFFKSRKNAKYFHRLRSSKQFWRDGKYSHTIVEFWCGAHTSVTNGRLYKEIPEGEVLCATCEGRAIGAGLVDSGKINGKPVAYSPRRAT